MFKRKIYDKLVEWKNASRGGTALMIEGARRIGKSTTAEEFAKNEYESYILIDFSLAPRSVKDLFDDIQNFPDPLFFCFDRPRFVKLLFMSLFFPPALL